jgi:hypothetical protein
LESIGRVRQAAGAFAEGPANWWRTIEESIVT